MSRRQKILLILFGAGSEKCSSVGLVLVNSGFGVDFSFFHADFVFIGRVGVGGSGHLRGCGYVREGTGEENAGGIVNG